MANDKREAGHNRTCPTCMGTGTIVCRSCGGAGAFMAPGSLGKEDKHFCAVCSGTGQTRCPTCFGTISTRDFEVRVEGVDSTEVEAVAKSLLNELHRFNNPGEVVMNPIKVLFFAANPTDTSSLKLDEEIRTITQKVRASERRDFINLISAWAVRPDDLLQSLNEHMPQIVHFSSHGSSKGEIILLDSSGNPKPVSVAALGALFKTLRDNVRVVVLNACYSRVQAEGIVECIDCTIGMNTAIGDQAAIAFAASFYRAIGFGRSVQEAFEQGKVALMLEGIPEHATPELLCKAGVNPSKLFLLDFR